MSERWWKQQSPLLYQQTHVLHTDCDRVMDVMEHVTHADDTHPMQRANPLIHKAYPDTRSYGAMIPPDAVKGGRAAADAAPSHSPEYF